jgi:hypothetical protein
MVMAVLILSIQRAGVMTIASVPHGISWMQPKFIR